MQNLTVNVPCAKESGSTLTVRASTFATLASSQQKQLPLSEPVAKPKAKRSRTLADIPRPEGRVQYARSFFKGELAEWAKLYLESLPTEVTTLVSIGSSGCSIAAAMVTLAYLQGRNLHHVALRKPHEEAHSMAAGSYTQPDTDSAWCLVDDFIDCGRSVISAWHNKYFQQDSRGKKKKPPFNFVLVHHTFDGDEYIQDKLNREGVLAKLITIQGD